jgi:PAS domain S-box-containing protein
MRAGSEALYVMNINGTTIAASNWNSSKSFVGENYAQRPYFKEALLGKTGIFYGIGLTTGIPGFFISAPIYEGDVIIGVSVIKLSLRGIETTWSELPAPIMVSDANGIFFLGSVSAWKLMSKRTVREGDLDRVRSHKQYGDKQAFVQVPWHIEPLNGQSGYLVHTNIDGETQRYLAFEKDLPELGWTLTVMSEYEPVVWAKAMALMLATLGAGLLVSVVLYWRLRDKRLQEQSRARQVLELRVEERTHELDEALAFQKAMEGSLSVGMRARDLEGRIVYVNAALCKMTGFCAKDLIGRLPPYPYWHPDDLDRHWNDNQTMLSGKAMLQGFESRIRHRDGHEVLTMVYTAPLVDSTGRQTGWISSVVDITEQKRTEDRQRLQDAQLQHTGRLASMGEMASTLAHELNQPLMALTNYASAAHVFAKDGKQGLLLTSLQEITLQAKRSADIVKRVRSFVRPNTAGVEKCQMNTVVGNALALLKPEINAQQTRVLCHLTENLACVAGDRILLEQVVLNLMMNSLQAMHGIPREEKLLTLESFLSDNLVCVRLTDCGTGIAPEIAKQLFEPFFTTKPKGLGLGLNICRTIVESHKGQLSFDNAKPKGAIFTLKLPASI